MTGWFLNNLGNLPRRSSYRHRKVPYLADNSLRRDPGQSSDAETQFRRCEDDVLIVNCYHGDHQAGSTIQ